MVRWRVVNASETHRAIRAVFGMESARLIAGLARIVRDVGLAEELVALEENKVGNSEAMLCWKTPFVPASEVIPCAVENRLP